MCHPPLRRPPARQSLDCRTLPGGGSLARHSRSIGPHAPARAWAEGFREAHFSRRARFSEKKGQAKDLVIFLRTGARTSTRCASPRALRAAATGERRQQTAGNPRSALASSWTKGAVCQCTGDHSPPSQRVIGRAFSAACLSLFQRGLQFVMV